VLSKARLIHLAKMRYAEQLYWSLRLAAALADTSLATTPTPANY